MPRTVTVSFEDGSRHTYEGVPDDATPDQVESRASQDFAGKKITSLDGGKGATAAPPVDHAKRLTEIEAELKKLDSEKPGIGTAAWEITKGFLKGTADTALNLGTGIVATPLAGVAGLATTAANLAAVPFSDVTVDDAVNRGAKVIEKGSEVLTWKPRSDVGQEAQANIAKPFELLAKGADAAATNIPLVNKSPLAQTAVNTGIQMLPALLFRGRAKAPVATGTAGEAGVATTAAQVATAAAEAAPNVVRAKAYVADRLGANWGALSKQVQDKLSTIANDSKALDQLDPAAIAREAKLQSLPAPVPATRGQLTRDPVALRNEGNASATTQGQPIRDVHLAANQALLDNLDILKGKVSGTGKTAATATTAEQTGSTVQGAARAKLDFQKAKVKELYKKADEAGETQAAIPDEGLIKVMDVVHETIDQPHFSYAKSWLQANAKKIDAGQLTIRDIESLRKQAVAKVLNRGEDAHYAGQLIKAIDEATEGAGGKMYQEARAARRAQALEFEEQGAVSDLVSNASRTDRTTALENTTKSIMQGSLEDVAKIKKTLLTGGDEATRTAGRKAWRDVRTQVVTDIKNAATKGVALNQDGSPNLSAAALKQVIDKYGAPKLDAIFGPGTTKQLNKILDAARDVKTMPPTQAVGSSTFANIIAFLERGLNKIPGGGTAANLARGAAQVKNIGAASREAAQATTTPLNEALGKAAAKSKRRQVVGTSDQLDPKLIPLSQVGSKQPEARN